MADILWSLLAAFCAAWGLLFLSGAREADGSGEFLVCMLLVVVFLAAALMCAREVFLRA